MVTLGEKKISFAMTANFGGTHDGFQAFETCPSPPQQQVIPNAQKDYCT